jgi:hypothetical protein
VYLFLCLQKEKRQVLKLFTFGIAKIGSKLKNSKDVNDNLLTSNCKKYFIKVQEKGVLLSL